VSRNLISCIDCGYNEILEGEIRDAEKKLREHREACKLARAQGMSVNDPSITCPRCGKVSYNPTDVEQRYCGACHAFHQDMKPN
jgi:ribosomal protein L37E